MDFDLDQCLHVQATYFEMCEREVMLLFLQSLQQTMNTIHKLKNQNWGCISS